MIGDFWRRLARNRLLDVGAVVVTVLLIFRWVSVLPSRWSDYDFNHYYVGSRMLLEGQNPYTTSLKTMSQALRFRFSEEYLTLCPRRSRACGIPTRRPRC